MSTVHKSSPAHTGTAQRPACQIRRLAPSLGAEIDGLDLNAGITDEVYGVIHQALLDHQVLFFRNQPIDSETHKALARRFGPLECHGAYPTAAGHPEVTIMDWGPDNRSKIDSWHTDMTFRPNPPLGAILRCVVVPEVGGDTMFASMSAAWDGLSDRWQQFLEGLECVHDFAAGFKESLAEPGGYERLKPVIDANPPVKHPLVIRHPETGRRALYVNSVFTTQIVGMSPWEGRAVLDFLFQHCTLPEFSVRFGWETDSVAFWDNRITQHRPVNDYWPVRRQMRRVVIGGEPPVAA